MSDTDDTFSFEMKPVNDKDEQNMLEIKSQKTSTSSNF